jgi:hypothetical protein
MKMELREQHQINNNFTHVVHGVKLTLVLSFLVCYKAAIVLFILFFVCLFLLILLFPSFRAATR